MKKTILISVLALSTGCAIVSHDAHGVTTIRTFGAATTEVGVTSVRDFGTGHLEVGPSCTIKTKSPGISEGFANFLISLPEAVLKVLSSMGGGFAGLGSQPPMLPPIPPAS